MIHAFIAHKFSLEHCCCQLCHIQFIEHKDRLQVSRYSKFQVHSIAQVSFYLE